MTIRRIDGNNILYHYLQKSLRKEDEELFQKLISKLIIDLGIWFPPSHYCRLPVPLPFVVRDASCRKRKKGQKDQWSSPDSKGLLRDDNTLIKNMVNTFEVNSKTFNEYHGHRLGNGFVAAHVWRLMSNEQLASKNPLTNSFWPNLIWLPRNVAKLTDIDGSFAQRFVQAISLKIYRNLVIDNELNYFVEKCWSLLPTDHGIADELIPDLTQINYFGIPSDFIDKKLRNIITVSDGLELVSQGRELPGKILHTRYTEGLPQVDPDAAQSLSSELAKYANAVQLSIDSQ